MSVEISREQLAKRIRPLPYEVAGELNGRLAAMESLKLAVLVRDGKALRPAIDEDNIPCFSQVVAELLGVDWQKRERVVGFNEGWTYGHFCICKDGDAEVIKTEEFGSLIIRTTYIFFQFNDGKPVFLKVEVEYLSGSKTQYALEYRYLCERKPDSRVG